MYTYLRRSYMLEAQTGLKSCIGIPTCINQLINCDNREPRCRNGYPVWRFRCPAAPADLSTCSAAASGASKTACAGTCVPNKYTSTQEGRTCAIDALCQTRTIARAHA